jgi:hypothetical protein
VVVPAIVPYVDVIVVDPAATEVAIPLAVIVATEVLEELHVTEVVRFCVELLENVPVAVNCWVAPTAMLGVAGVTAMDTRVGSFTGRPTASRRVIIAHSAVICASPYELQQAVAAGVTASSPTAICSTIKASTAVTLPVPFKSHITVAIPGVGKAASPSKTTSITNKNCTFIFTNKYRVVII